jgi:hypothetical protein
MMNMDENNGLFVIKFNLGQIFKNLVVKCTKITKNILKD